MALSIELFPRLQGSWGCCGVWASCPVCTLSTPCCPCRSTPSSSTASCSSSSSTPSRLATTSPASGCSNCWWAPSPLGLLYYNDAMISVQWNPTQLVFVCTTLYLISFSYCIVFCCIQLVFDLSDVCWLGGWGWEVGGFSVCVRQRPVGWGIIECRRVPGDVAAVTVQSLQGWIHQYAAPPILSIP